MPLSEQEKQRIREEETYRLQVRDELQKSASEPNRWKVAAFWSVLVAVAVLLFTLMRRGNP
jgi:hypothetical protein